MKGLKRKYIRVFSLMSGFILLACIVIPSFFQVGQENSTARRIRLVEPDKLLVELEHCVSQVIFGGEALLGILRDFILDSPSQNNLRFLGDLKGEARENAIAEKIVSLIREIKDESSVRMANLTYALRYLYLDLATHKPLLRILAAAKDFSVRNNILTGFISSYFEKDIIGAAGRIYILDNESGEELTRQRIAGNPAGTFVTIMDVDNLSRLNRAYGKSVLDYVLDDIKRTVMVTLSQFDGSFAYTNSGRDELHITLSGVEDIAQAKDILLLINKRIWSKCYEIIKLNSETNSFISRLSPGEFERMKQALADKSIGISDGEYIRGEYLLLIPVSLRQPANPEATEDFLGNFFPQLNNYLTERGFSFEVMGDVFFDSQGEPINDGLLPRVTVSLGAVSAGYEPIDGRDLFELASQRANNALTVAKLNGKNAAIIFSSETEILEDNNGIFTPDFESALAIEASAESSIPAEQRDALYPYVYDSDILRSVINSNIEQERQGFLIWIEPRYYLDGENPSRFKAVNSRYGLRGGDKVVQALFYLLRKNMPDSLKDSVIIGRNSPDGLMLYLPEANAELNSEQISALSGLLDRVKQEFEQNATSIRIGLDAAIKGTHDISEAGKLFFLTEYTHDSVAAEIIPTDLGNSLMFYTPEVLNDIERIQRERQRMALEEISEYLSGQ